MLVQSELHTTVFDEGCCCCWGCFWPLLRPPPLHEDANLWRAGCCCFSLAAISGIDKWKRLRWPPAAASVKATDDLLLIGVSYCCIISEAKKWPARFSLPVFGPEPDPAPENATIFGGEVTKKLEWREMPRWPATAVVPDWIPVGYLWPIYGVFWRKKSDCKSLSTFFCIDKFLLDFCKLTDGIS